MTKNIRILLALVATSAVLLTACSPSDTATIDTVSPQEAHEQLAGEPDTILLDIRTPEEFAQVRIPGAVNIDFYASDFAERLAELDRNRTYVVYCRSGNRTRQAQSVFADLDFTSVHDVDGGIVAWSSVGLPVEP